MNFHSRITRDQVHICQKYFERILYEVEFDNFTSQSLNRQFDQKGIEEDYKKIERIIKSGCHPNFKNG